MAKPLDDIRDALSSIEDIASRLKTFCAPFLADVSRYVDQINNHLLNAGRAVNQAESDASDTPATSPEDTPDQ